MRVFFYILFGIIASLPAPSSVLSSDWAFYGDAPNQSMFYYDKESLTYSPNGIVKVWDKEVYSTRSRDYLISKRKEFNEKIDGYSNLEYTLFQFEFDCRKRQSRMVSTTDYGFNGEMLAAYKAGDKIWDWDAIAPDTRLEALFRKICAKKRRK